MRLKQPLVKTFGRFIKTDWHEALQIVADRFGDIINKYGPESIGVLVSAKISNEENYLAQKFARAVIGTNNVDHCARL
jgi:predicted molibdopterin-dependent oxidoreductase YjgC